MWPKLGVRGLSVVEITPQQAIFTGRWCILHQKIHFSTTEGPIRPPIEASCGWLPCARSNIHFGCSGCLQSKQQLKEWIAWMSILMVGAALIKNYASLKKYNKMFHVFFLKISSYWITPKNQYVTTLLLPCQFCSTPSTLKSLKSPMVANNWWWWYRALTGLATYLVVLGN